MKRWEWQSAGGRTFAVYAPDFLAASDKFKRIGRHHASKPFALVPLDTTVDVQDERRAPGA